MWRLVRISLIFLAVLAVPVVADQTMPSEPRVLIVEFMSASSASANDEFVELYNDSDQLVSADKLKLQYKSASGADWVTKAALSGELQPRGRFLISTTGLVDETDIERASLGLAASGGHLRLIRDDGAQHEYDQIAWGDAQQAQTSSMPAPEKDKSMKRLLDEDGYFVDNNDDSVDFFQSDSPTPERSLPLPKPPNSGAQSPSKPRNYGSSSTLSTSANTRSGPFADVMITELMIDPDKPLTDADDEYVELFNPNDFAVDLEDYRIETGLTYSYGFTLPSISISPGEYMALYSIDTNLTLSNAGGQAKLMDPDGKTLFEVPAYENAKPNFTWALIGETWQWTAQPTPAAANVAVDGESGEDSEGLLDASSSFTGGRYSRIENRNVYEEPPPLDSDQLDTTVVAGVGSLALLYAGYEYRYDIANRFNQLKRYIGRRRSGGAAS